ncbi:MAG: hypothetical protein MUE73_17490 [Planctomycetes bacterium]|jgi:hypothetical protein|nr:hypothetical protein [Planctomycetota bacterium]
MMHRKRILTIVVLVALAAGPAFALEEIIGKDGRSAMVEVLETSEDSLTVEYRIGETVVKAVVPARVLDPYSFYSSRKRHMADTAEDHLALSLFCFRSGLFILGKRHFDMAAVLNPELVSGRAADHTVLCEDCVAKMLAEARVLADKGDFGEAEFLLTLVVDVFPETKAAAEVGELLAGLDARRAKQEEAERAAQMEKLADEAREAAAARYGALKPIADAREAARKLYQQGLRARNQSTAKGFLEQAISQYRAILEAINVRRKTAGPDTDLAGDLLDLEKAVLRDVIRAHVVAGGISLSRGAYNDAEQYARNALSFDPESAEARDFLVRVQTAIAYKDYIDVRTRRPSVPGRVTR